MGITSKQGLNDSLIMMLDDEPVMLDLIGIFLEEAGYRNYLPLQDSRQAVELVLRRKPDVLLLDLVMPQVDGFQVLAALRRHQVTRHLPIIVLTSSSDSTTKLKALELGATDFLAKPVDESELVLRLRNILTVKAYQDQLIYYDHLTGLPNRLYLTERLQKLTAHHQQQGQLLAVLNSKITNLKSINDSYGHSISDQLLVSMADRLINRIRHEDLVTFIEGVNPVTLTAHTENGDFSLVLTHLLSAQDAALVAERLIESFKAPFCLQEKDYFVEVALGISLFPSDSEQAEELLKNAGYAAELASQQGQNLYHFYSRQANEQLKQRLELQQDLRRALVYDQFYLLYQPQVDASSYRVRGAEALLRWQHPQKGNIPPDVFIPLAEQCGLMEEIGHLVLQQGCLQAARWQQQGLGISVSINVSGAQFHARHFVQTVADCLQHYQVDPAGITLELTENVAIDNVQNTIQLLQALRQLGVKISVDDFGTGYSSLSYLKDFPLDELKIDKSFVDGLPDKVGDQAVAQAIISMAATMQFSVVAEGVEQRRQVDYLASIGCDLIQGFYFSRPITAAQLQQYALGNRS